MYKCDIAIDTILAKTALSAPTDYQFDMSCVCFAVNQGEKDKQSVRTADRSRTETHRDRINWMGAA